MDIYLFRGVSVTEKSFEQKKHTTKNMDQVWGGEGKNKFSIVTPVTASFCGMFFFKSRGFLEVRAKKNW